MDNPTSPMSEEMELKLLGDESYETTLAAYGLSPGDQRSADYVARLMRIPQHAAQLKPYEAELRADKLLPPLLGPPTLA